MVFEFVKHPHLNPRKMKKKIVPEFSKNTTNSSYRWLSSIIVLLLLNVITKYLFSVVVVTLLQCECNVVLLNVITEYLFIVLLSWHYVVTRLITSICIGDPISRVIINLS